jgi:hypothetical protein
MRNVNAELLLPRAEEIQNLVQMAYDAGRERGREEAMREQQGFQDPPRFDKIEIERGVKRSTCISLRHGEHPPRLRET